MLEFQTLSQGGGGRLWVRKTETDHGRERTPGLLWEGTQLLRFTVATTFGHLCVSKCGWTEAIL